METKKNIPVFIDVNGTFELENADLYNNLYFPLAGECGLKSAITPTLGGDSKTDQNHFLYAPASIENLNNDRLSRNFWCVIDKKTAWSASGNSASQNAARLTKDRENCKVTAGFMWHRVNRENKALGIKSEITSFIPYNMNIEIHMVRITNTGKAKDITFIPSLPIYGRSADNIRDHRHVTSLLNRVKVTENGMIDHPTFSFDERGHRLADAVYFVEGFDESGNYPEAFYPVLDEFVGAGTPDWPEAVVKAGEGVKEYLPGDGVNGQEIAGAFRFKAVKLKENASVTYVIYAGTAPGEAKYAKVRKEINDINKVTDLFESTKEYWVNKVNIKVTTGDRDFDNYMRWVAFQPILRRIFGCSFLPHHDYGKGGRGWRDLWQDCLALLLMDPSGVRNMLIGNFSGTRVDGTNATIIGEKTGEFKADRNSITRVWMDHGVWPLITTALYIGQTGDAGILLEECGYFKDRQIFRGRKMADGPVNEDNRQRDTAGALYNGTVLEHILVQTLTAFWETGEHNICLLRDADWNDALDMAGSRGESVAFACAYAGNLETIADILDSGVLGTEKLYMFEPMGVLLTDDGLYDDIAGRKELIKTFLERVATDIPVNRAGYAPSELADNLRNKAAWLKAHIAGQEWIEDGDDGWFNGYYDNNGRVLDLTIPGRKNMMLTGQVFSIMNGIADESQVKKIVRSADRLLFDEASGGYRLNTDFGEVKTDMGRMFGFAFGEKENGAVFSHMAVMYSNALYKRGFAKEGYKGMNALYRASSDFKVSQIYPGIPEYFGRGGKGLYGYLTGAASWYLMTVVMNMFGVYGEYGDLIISPALLKDQFDESGVASLEIEFAGKPLKIDIVNRKRSDVKEYSPASLTVDGHDSGECIKDGIVRIEKNAINTLDPGMRHRIEVVLR